MDDLLRMCSAVMACEHDDIYNHARKRDEKICALEKLVGFSIDTLINLLSRGYILIPGATNTSMEELAKELEGD